MLSLFLLLKNEICFDLAGSSGQISCLSFQFFSLVPMGLNPFVHDFLWVHNIGFFAASLHGRRHLQRVTAQYGKKDARRKTMLGWLVM